jgi:3-hydroxyisobutyrate dehydrogenase
MAERVAWIGLGAMGAPMAACVLRAGHFLRVFNRNSGRPALAALAQAGAEIAESPRLAAEGAHVVFVTVTGPADVLEVVAGPEGALQGLTSGATLVDCSTIDPGTCLTVAEACAAKGVSFLDAPVSGGTKGAEMGTLTAMVGGDPSSLEGVRPLLSAFAAAIYYAGPTGSGQKLKLCNNLVFLTTSIAVAEGFALGLKAGLDPQVLYEVVRRSTGQSLAWDTRAPWPANNHEAPPSHDYALGYSVDLCSKDLALITSLAEQLQVPVPATALTRHLYALVGSAGGGGQDCGLIGELFKGWAGLPSRLPWRETQAPEMR